MPQVTKIPCLILLALAFAAVAGGCRKPPGPTPEVTIGDRRWFVDVALTRADREAGLSGRGHIPDDVGMLFVFRRPEILEFCMRGCHVPIDIAFIDAKLRIVAIETMAVEPDRAGVKIYSSPAPALYALEVAGGTLTGAGIRVGDKVTFSAEIPPPAKADPRP